MAVRVEPATAGDLDQIARLLSTAFAASPDAPFVSRDLLRWKYLEPGVTPATRSYVLRQGTEILAHCGVHPLALRVPRHAAEQPASVPDSISGICFLDWAADRRLPGAGFILLKKLMATADVSVVASGSDDTRALVPRIGFTRYQTVDVLARVVRPIRQIRSRPRTGVLRDALRLLRNTMWRLTPRGRLATDWQAVPARRFTTLPETSTRSLVPEHGPEYLNYWLRCPSAAVSGYEIRRRGRLIGHFLLSRIGGQSRVADLRLCAESPSDLAMAFRLAFRTAVRDPATCEVVCLGSTEETRVALEACGFRRRGAAPLFVHDPRGVLAAASPIAWSMIDDDTACVYDPVNPYTT